MQMELSFFLDKNPFNAGTSFFKQLNIPLNSSSTSSLPLKSILKDKFKSQEIFKKVFATYFLGLVDRSVFDDNLSLFDAGWGRAVVRQLADHIRKTDPDSKGFSAQNLWRMKQFYETCREREKLSPVVREIHPDAENIFKDVYLVNFLDIPESHTESDLQKGLVANLKKFLFELGRDFCFIGEEFQVQVGGKDFYIDLLFFHRGLSCLVAFELKINDFKPEHLGKLPFYLEALDRDVRGEHEKTSVGVLLCKSKDEEVVEYALSRTLSPALMSEYQTRLPDKNMLRLKLHEFYELAYRSLADQETVGEENDDRIKYAS